jgi:hypothetical protein
MRIYEGKPGGATPEERSKVELAMRLLDLAHDLLVEASAVKAADFTARARKSASDARRYRRTARERAAIKRRK